MATQGFGGILEELAARWHYWLSPRDLRMDYHLFRSLDWDRRRGVQTVGEILLKDLVYDSPSREHALYYAPISVWTNREIMGGLRTLGVRPSEFTFVDFGCGKGRVLLMALEAGFRQIHGIEIVPELAHLASENLRSYRGRGPRQRVTVHCTDAATFPIPAGSGVEFLNNPFTGPVLDAVAENIRRSFEESPRPMFVVHIWVPSSPFDRGPPFVRVASVSRGAIYRLEAHH
jgi:hypothetical protein